MIAPLAFKKVFTFLINFLEVPRHTSKILSTTAKKPAANTLIGDFDRKNFTGAGDTYLKKADKKDLSRNKILYFKFRKCHGS